MPPTQISPKSRSAKEPAGKRSSGFATLADVARLANVSQTTASFVLNGRDTSIPPPTRERVQTAARQLRYAKSAQVSALQQGRTQALGIHFNARRGMFPSDPVTGQALAGISQSAQAQGYHLVLYTGLPIAPDGEEAPVQAFLDRRVDGMILIAPPMNSVLMDEIARAGLPCAILFSRHVPANLAYVNAQNDEGGKLATDHLLELGHKRVAHLAGSPGFSNFADRVDGYKAALHAWGVPFDPALLVPVGPDEDVEPVLRVLLQLPDPPTALFCYNERCAVRTIQAAQALGLRVPDDVSVIGCDDTLLATTVSPQLTTIRQPLVEMGQRVASALADLIEGVPAEERRISLPVELVVRGSTSAAAAPPPHRSKRNLYPNRLTVAERPNI